MAVACFSLFLSMVGFGIIIPVQPFYAESMGATPLMITSLGAVFSLMQFLCAPLWGRLSDRIGRRPVMLASIAIGALGHLAFGMARSFGALFAVRALAGFGMANQGTAQAIISDITTPDSRARGMGLMGASFGLGFIVGPALGGLMGQYDERYPAYAAAALSCVNWVMAWWWLPETRAAETTTTTPGGVPFIQGRSIFALKTAFEVARKYDVGRIMVTSLIVSFSFSLMEQVISLFLEHVFVDGGGRAVSVAHRSGEATMLTAWFMVTVGVVMVVVQAGLIGRLRARFGESRLLRAGVLIMALAQTSLPVAGHWGVFGGMLVVAALLAAGSGLYNPSSTALISLAVASEEQGVVLGANQSMGALGRIAGPLVGGALYQIEPSWPFVVAGGMMIIGYAAARAISPAGSSREVVPLQSASS